MAKSHELRFQSRSEAFASWDVTSKSDQKRTKKTAVRKPAALLVAENGASLANFTAIISPASKLQKMIEAGFENPTMSADFKRWPLAYSLTFALGTSLMLWVAIFKLVGLAFA
jgi:hypothetical protein